MAVTKITFGTSTAITITLNSLAASATVGRQATVIDNSSNLFDDALVTAIIAPNTGSNASAPAQVNIYVSGSEDGTNFDQDDAAMGATDAGYTINNPTNLKLAAIINCPTKNVVYNETFSVAQLFGGVMPRKWTVVVCNNLGQTLAASGNSMSYTGITYTTV